MVDYSIWTPLHKPGFCTLDFMQGFGDTWSHVQGKPLKDKFPSGVQFSMNKSFPKDIKLGDGIRNFDSAIVISKNLAEFLQQKDVPAVEYLPVSIINHKGRLASADYFILNVLAIQDCLDIEKSRPYYKMNCIDAVNQIVLDESKIDPLILLFKLKDFNTLLLVEGKLADALAAQSFTNIKFKPISDYKPYS